MQEIKIDFDNPGLPHRLDVVENDAQSRFFKAVLYKDGKAYVAPSGATYSIMYRGFGPQNEGWYDTINDGAGKRAACSVSGNVVTCEIARQALRVPGHVSVVLCVTGSNGYMLHGWPIDCNCRNYNYTSGTSVESFFYITQVTNADWTSAIQTWEELKNMIDPTLSLSGKAADAAKVGEAVGQLKEDTVKANKNLVSDEIIFKGKSKFTGKWKPNAIASDITFYKGHPWHIIINLHSDVVGSSYIQIKDQSGQVFYYWQLENLKTGKHKFFYVPELDREHSSVCITSDTYVDTCDFEISNNYINNIEKLSFEVDYLKKDEHKFDYTKFILGQIYDKYFRVLHEVQNEKPFIFAQDILVRVNDGFTFCITGFNSDGTYNNYYSGWKTSNEPLVVKKNTYFRIGITKEPNADITSMEEIKEYVSSVTYSLGDTVDDIRNDISNLNASIQNKISNKMMLNIIQNDFYFSHLDVSYYDGLIVPSQSIYDVMRSKRLGFKMMELNVRKTSDGVFYAFHGSKNCFGDAFYSLDNTDISNVNVSNITSEYINNNIRYKSKYKKYQVTPSTLKEVLIECKKNQIIPIIEYSNGVIEFVKSIMSENSYIIGIYNWDRPKDIGDSICTSWIYGDVDSVIEKANKSGGCYICGIDVTKNIYQSFDTDEWTDYIGKIHNSGYFVTCAYQSQKDTQKLLNAGIDLMASHGSINDLKCGNIFDSESDMFFSNFITNGTIDDGILHLNNGQTIIPSNLSENVFLGGSSMYIIFNGNIHIKMGIIDEEFASDGKNTLWFSTFYQESIPTFLITAKSDDTRILYLSFKSSKL